MTTERKWTEKRIAGGKVLADGLFVRVAIGELNDCYADFEVIEEEIDASSRLPEDPVVRRCIARGDVKFDGCMNVDLALPDGVLQHWCDEKGIVDFGCALVEARRMAAAIIPLWMGD